MTAVPQDYRRLTRSGTVDARSEPSGVEISAWGATREGKPILAYGVYMNGTLLGFVFSDTSADAFQAIQRAIRRREQTVACMTALSAVIPVMTAETLLHLIDNARELGRRMGRDAAQKKMREALGEV